MSTKEVTTLRKAGKLIEAESLALTLLEQEPDNIWNKRAAAWVYYDFLKQNDQAQDKEAYLNYLHKVYELQLTNDEDLFFKNIVYSISAFIHSLAKEPNNHYNAVNQVFNYLTYFHFNTSLDEYSMLLQAFLKFKDWNGFGNFVRWWDLKNLNPKDFESTEYNGRSMMSLAEKAHAAYCKSLLKGDLAIVNGFVGGEYVVNPQKIRDYLPMLDQLISEHPNYKYSLYYKAKLLLEIKEYTKAVDALLPFALQKQNDSWVWSLLADAFNDQPQLQIACNCKALTLKSKPAFLINTRLHLAQLLIDAQHYDKAKFEIETIIKVRQQNNWSVDKEVTALTQQSWYANTQATTDNTSFYHEHKKLAQDLLYKDIPNTQIVVTYVNPSKHMLNFIDEQKNQGFFKYQGLIKNPKIGGVLNVKFTDQKDQFYKAAYLEPVAVMPTDSKVVKKFEGLLRQKTPGSFGFIDDVFISPKILDKTQYTDQDQVSGIAVKSFNKRKNEWGWSALSLN